MVDWPRLIRALFGQPEPVSDPVIKEVQVPAPATMDNLRAMIARLGQGLQDAAQCKLWYEIEQMAFEELGQVMIDTYEITPVQVQETVIAQYPGLADLMCPDSQYWCTDPAGMQKLLTRDWTNLVLYVVDRSDCDKFANRLYEHCCRYYQLNTVFPVWGRVTGGYHAFNCVVLNDGGELSARLIEPQSDSIFISEGPAGQYNPDTTSEALGILNTSKGGLTNVHL